MVGCPGFRYTYRWPQIGPKVLGEPQPPKTDIDELVAFLEDRDRAIEDFVSALPCKQGGLRFATVVVGCSNSKDPDPTHYDYFCTGTNDDLVIQTAVNAVQASTALSGQVLIMEGTYNFGTGTVGVQGLHNAVDIVGMSGSVNDQGGTNFNIPAGLTNDNFSIFDNFNRVSDIAVFISGNAGKTIRGISNTYIIERNLMQVGGAGNFASIDGIQAIGGGVVAHNTVFRVASAGAGTGIRCPSGDTTLTVHDNIIDACDVGIRVDNSQQNVHDNVISSCHVAGILFKSTSQDNSVHDNYLLDNTPTQMIVDGSYNNVQGNTARKSSATPTTGIKVNAGATGNLVTNNDLHNSATTSFTDAGTATVTVAGNRL